MMKKLLYEQLKIINNINEEPIIDYDDSKPILNVNPMKNQHTHSDLGVSSSFIVPQTSINNVLKNKHLYHLYHHHYLI